MWSIVVSKQYRNLRLALGCGEVIPVGAFGTPVCVKRSVGWIEISDFEAQLHDVGIFFPHVKPEGAELWTSVSFLSMSWPYFKTLLKSDFTEFVTRESRRRRTELERELRVVELEGHGNRESDSDHETAELLFIWPSSMRRTPTHGAVLLNLATDHSEFALPAIPDHPLTPSATGTHADYLTRFLARTLNLPAPVSLKSACKLVHLLELAGLQELNLVTLSRWLPDCGVLDKLVSRGCTRHYRA
ncbi:hypothetical protein JCM10450v2_004740 [Rhodotorula kratochvilovae]